MGMNIDALKKKIQEANPEIKKRVRRTAYEQSRRYKLANKDKVSLQGKRYYAKYKDKLLVRHKAYNENGGNLRRYGITLSDYKQLLYKQENRCAICGCVETSKIKDVVKRLGVDHDHETGAVRGLLCNSCNRGIGYLRDSSVVVRRAVIYLKTYGK